MKATLFSAVANVGEELANKFLAQFKEESPRTKADSMKYYDEISKFSGMNIAIYDDCNLFGHQSDIETAKQKNSTQKIMLIIVEDEIYTFYSKEITPLYKPGEKKKSIIQQPETKKMDIEEDKKGEKISPKKLHFVEASSFIIAPPKIPQVSFIEQNWVENV